MSLIKKPLSKLERDEIAQALFYGWTHNDHARHLVELLFDDAKFWREAVKQCNEGHGEDNACAFCGISIDFAPHKQDCPWKLSQEIA